LTPFGPQPKGQGQAKVVMIASALAFFRAKGKRKTRINNGKL